MLPDRRGGRPESSLPLRSHGGGTPPSSGPGEGDVTSPYSWSIAGTTGTSLLRGTAIPVGQCGCRDGSALRKTSDCEYDVNLKFTGVSDGYG